MMSHDKLPPSSDESCTARESISSLSRLQTRDQIARGDNRTTRQCSVGSEAAITARPLSIILQYSTVVSVTDEHCSQLHDLDQYEEMEVYDRCRCVPCSHRARSLL